MSKINSLSLCVSDKHTYLVSVQGAFKTQSFLEPTVYKIAVIKFVFGAQMIAIFDKLDFFEQFAYDSACIQIWY